MNNRNGRKTVVCRKSWAYADPTPTVRGRRYIVLKSFWRNGEGWYRLLDCETEAMLEAPDIFFTDADQRR